MTPLRIPACFHPTRVVLVDDNPAFLKSLQDTLAAHQISCTSFESPLLALQYLSALPTHNPLLTALQQAENKIYEEPLPEHLALMSLQKISQDPHRHQAITLVISDYDMPEITGDLFFTAFKHPHIKKIMLTGHADYEMAVQLFNQRVIDNFLVKEVFSITEGLPPLVRTLQQQYFTDLCAQVTDTLFTDHPYVLGPDYHHLLTRVLSKHKITEHYTVSKNGSKYLKDAQGQSYHLALATADELAGFLQTAELACAPADVLTKLRAKTHMPVLLSPKALKLPPTQWAAYLEPIVKAVLEGCEVGWVMSRN